MVDVETKMQFVFALRSGGVTDKKVLEAMEKVPRDIFVQGHFKPRAYEDLAIPIASGQTISQPSIVGKMTTALDVNPRDKVLEIGTGSGYQTAILSQLARRVYTIERHPGLARDARKLLGEMQLTNVIAIKGDGSQGLEDQAPFDRILLTAAAEDAPANLLAQLRVGGIMVLPVGQTNAIQHLIKVEKTEHGFEYNELGPVRFVPLIEGVAQEP
ncbi:MAG: protein-L-isoaspartate O-methyltransferase [Rhodobacteraceae bacterium]|nr:protein-L-isoaspartate O-methyltransferase [Paracoccaceae bacterium]